MKRKKKSFVCKYSVSLVSCESMQDSVKNPRHVAGYEKVLTPDWAAVPVSIKSKEREGWEGRQADDKKRKKNSVCCKRETKTLEGDRCLEAVLESEGCGGGEMWNKDQGAPCCESVSDSPLRSCEHRLRMRSPSRSPSLLHCPYIIPILFKWMVWIACFPLILPPSSLSASFPCCLAASLTH